MEIVNSPSFINGIKVAKDYGEVIESLKNNELVMHYEYGDSLSPLLNSGEYALIKPCKPIEVKRGDCVFCEVQGVLMVHQVWEISDASHTNELWFKIGSSMNTIYGWTKKIYGIAKGTDVYQGLS